MSNASDSKNKMKNEKVSFKTNMSTAAMRKQDKNAHKPNNASSSLME